nr:tRNA lysidine(34) synthetase TilS [Bacteroidota bacterium]
MMELQKRFEAGLAAIIDKDAKILLTTSGGVDSMVMLKLFAESKIKFEVAHCNFKLRGSESDGDERLVKKACSLLNVPFHSIKFDTKKYAAANNLSIQMAAREMRYKWFDELIKKQKLNFIATAHHADDNAETFLINLLRGTGLAGLSGIKMKTESIIRPLLRFSKSELTEFAKEQNLKWRDDKSNAENKYLRNNLRNQIMPLLQKINTQAVEHINHAALNIESANILLGEYIEQLKNDIQVSNSSADKGALEYNFKTIINHKQLTLIVFYIVQPYGFKNSDIENICECLRNKSGKRFESENFVLQIYNQHLIISKCKEDKPTSILWHAKTKKVTFGGYAFTSEVKKFDDDFFKKIKSNSNNSVAYFDSEKLVFPLNVRCWQKGDKFSPLGMKGQIKKVSDFFVDLHINFENKKSIPIITTQDKIIWIAGYRIDDNFKVTINSRNILVLTMKFEK